MAQPERDNVIHLNADPFPPTRRSSRAASGRRDPQQDTTSEEWDLFLDYGIVTSD